MRRHIAIGPAFVLSLVAAGAFAPTTLADFSGQSPGVVAILTQHMKYIL